MKKIIYLLLILFISLEGIAQISLIGQGCDSSPNFPLNFISYKGNLYYNNVGCSNNPDGIYRTNGDSLGTLLTGTNFKSFDNYPNRRGVSGKNIFFSENAHLRIINGESSQVEMILENIIPTHITDLNGIALFSQNGTNLWRSDGTEAGTYKIKDMPVWNIVSDGTYAYVSDQFDLWKTDGTASGTVKMNFRYPIVGTSNTNDSTYVFSGSLTHWNGITFLINNGEYSTPLQKIQGNSLVTLGYTGCYLDASQTICSGFDVAANAGGLYPTSTGIFFFGKNYTAPGQSANYELWKSDGTVGGTVKVISFSAGTTPYMPIRANDYNSYPKQNYDNIFFFTATDPTNGIELWRSDGTAAGTFMVKDINAGPADSRPQGLGVIDGICYFSAVTADNGREIWKSNGTEAGTMMVQDLDPGTANGVISPEPPNENLNNRWATIYNGRYYFKGISPIAGGNLFAVDGLKHYVYRQLTPTASTIDIAKKAIFLETGTLILPSINVFYEGKIQNNN